MTDDRLARVLATGITEAEIAEADVLDVDMYDYAAARTAGATHAEVLEVAEVGHEGLCGYYTHLRASEGDTHAEAMVKVQTTAELLTVRAEADTASAERLVVLAGHEDSIVRFSVARNPSTPPDVLARLAKPRDTRAAVAGNPSTPPEVLAKLAVHKAWTVHKAVLRNPNTPPEVLAEHDRHRDEYWGEYRRPVTGVVFEPPMPPEADQLQM